MTCFYVKELQLRYKIIAFFIKKIKVKNRLLYFLTTNEVLSSEFNIFKNQKAHQLIN